MLDTPKPQFENLYAQPEKIVALLIADVQELQSYFLRSFVKTEDAGHAENFNRCNRIIGQLEKLR